MEEEKPTVLVVDDEPINLEIIQEIFAEDYRISSATSGAQCFDLVAQQKPDLILLDVNMPGMDGLEVCRWLKADPGSRDIPVVFVSAMVTDKDRAAGYAVGAEDYIAKPFSDVELRAKVGLILTVQDNLRKLSEDAQSAMGTAMTAMSSAGELGVVLHFLRETFTCNSIVLLAEMMVEVLDQYGLSGTVLLRTGDGDVLSGGHEAEVSSIEREILELMGGTDKRIHSFGARSIFNFDRVLILVKNMPLDNEGLCGRHRDNIAILSEGADARLQALQLQVEVEQQHGLLWKIVNNTEQALADIDLQHEDQQSAQSRMMDELDGRLEEVFSTLKLEEKLEKQLLEVVGGSVKDVARLYEEGLQLGQRIDVITADVRKALEEGAGAMRLHFNSLGEDVEHDLTMF